MAFHLLHLKNYPIFEQLQLEEALLRTDHRNWCLINEGTTPAIVMGISGKMEQLVNKEKVRGRFIPIIRRFSGGGTVIVDEQTLFITFICQKELHAFGPYPEPILKWSEELYKAAFDLPHFHLKENDYVIGEKKCGGNAQYLKKDRWLHHTSFLWDYQPHFMDYLLHPPKTPKYRQGRGHLDFLTRLRDHILCKDTMIANIKRELKDRYGVKEIELSMIKPHLTDAHRQSTQLVSF